MGRIDGKLVIHSLPRPSFDTQTSIVLRQEARSADQEKIRGISVLCLPNNPTAPTTVVVESDRGQVLDGVIQYENKLVIILESKLVGDDPRQAGNIKFNNELIEFVDPVVTILWRDILADFSDIADDMREIVTGAERIILDDFLAFVDAHFSYLGPFSNIRRCAGNPTRIARRLDKVLAELLNNDAGSLPGAHETVVLARLAYGEEAQTIELEMWPADTLDQARSLYNRPEAIKRLLLLAENAKWDIRPNFHFGFIKRGFCWLETPLRLPDYVQYWQRNIGNTGQVPRDRWNEYWDTLVESRIVNARDREKFDSDFTNANKANANPRPGIECLYTWSLGEAERLDGLGRFEVAVREQINELLKALGENLLPG